MSDLAIRTRGLTRYFGKRCVVRDVGLSVPRGSVFAFLGRNGCGKTTTIQMLLGFLPPTRGSAEVLGEDSRALRPATRARIAYMAEGHRLPWWMKLSDLERFQSPFFPAWDGAVFRSVLGHFRIEPSTRVYRMSRGERAGACLALALAQNAELLILDDPALGLDAVVRRALLEAMVYFTRREGRTILFSSHLLDEVERVADRVAILDGGVLRVQGSVEMFRERVTTVGLSFSGVVPEVPRTLQGLLTVDRGDGRLTVTLANMGDEARRAIAAFGAERVEESHPSLQDAFLRYLAKGREGGSLLASVGGGR